MRYKFPKIRHINDVLPAIEGRDEFIVARREHFDVINYMVNLTDTFPAVNTVYITNGDQQLAGDLGDPIFETNADYHAAIRRECRGIIFDKASGRILRRPLMKFFNLFEKDETQLSNLDFNLPHRVYTKLDGSFIVPFELGYGSGNICFGTKMGATEVSAQVEDFVAKNTNYIEFSRWCISNDISPIFEWTSRKQRIVLDYPEDQLTLLAARHMFTGEFLELSL